MHTHDKREEEGIEMNWMKNGWIKNAIIGLGSLIVVVVGKGIWNRLSGGYEELGMYNISTGGGFGYFEVGTGFVLVTLILAAIGGILIGKLLERK